MDHFRKFESGQNDLYEFEWDPSNVMSTRRNLHENGPSEEVNSDHSVLVARQREAGKASQVACRKRIKRIDWRWHEMKQRKSEISVHFA